MKVQEINEGTKAGYSLIGTMLTVTVGTQSVDIDLVASQQDTQQVVDVSLDENRQLKLGVEKWYVASIVIPPQKMHLVDSGQVDENDNPILLPETLPLDMDEVSLILWALPTLTANSEGGTL